MSFAAGLSRDAMTGRNLEDGQEPGKIAGKGGDGDAALEPVEQLIEPAADIRLGTGMAGAEDIGRIAGQHPHIPLGRPFPQ